jgi:hypothetical protein
LRALSIRQQSIAPVLRYPMLFDLRVVLAACLATFIFVVAGIGLMSGSRSSFKAAADGPRIAGPGLPQSMPLPLPDRTRGEEVTGTVADHGADSGATSVALKPQEMVPDRVRDGEKVQDSPREKAQEKAQEKALERTQEKAQTQEKVRETRAAPARGKGRQTITSLIEQDAAAHPKAAAKPKPRRRRVHPKQAKQPAPSTNPFAAFMNNNAARQQQQTTVR